MGSSTCTLTVGMICSLLLTKFHQNDAGVVLSQSIMKTYFLLVTQPGQVTQWCCFICFSICGSIDLLG